MERFTSSRIDALDFIRGVAVLGLLLMNITAMGFLTLDYVPPAKPAASDTLVEMIRLILLDGRFRSLFCLLFGIGLYIQFERFNQRQLDGARVLSRRLNWLLVIGLVHGIFIWPGDILLTYALCGLIVKRHLAQSASELKKKGVIYFSVGMALLVPFVLVSIYTDAPITRNASLFSETLDTLKMGYGYYVIENASLVLLVVLLFPFLMLFYICGVMFIGLGFYKSGELTSGFSSKQVNWLVSITLIALLLDVTGFLLFDEWLYHTSGFIACISGLTMALLFWHWVVTKRISQSNKLIIIAFKRAGRMALTLYVSQSIIGVALLRLVFPEWNTTFSLLDYTLLAVAIGLVQLFMAYAYMSICQQGPLERVWRQLVNAKKCTTSETTD